MRRQDPCLEHLSELSSWSEDNAREFFAAHAKSKLELPAFAKKHNICIGRVYRWRKKLDLSTPRPNGSMSRPVSYKPRQPRAPIQLVEVEVREPATTETTPIVIVIDDHIRVEVASGFDPAHLSAVIEVLRRC